MIRQTLFMAVLAIASFAAPKTMAQSPALDDAESPEFQEALADWLEGEDDLASLRSFAGLAHAGNVAAQIFLGRIARRTDYFLDDTLSGLSRKEKRDLMRAPGGVSGTSWLKIAGTSHPLARAMYEARNDQTNEAEIDVLLYYGERSLALLEVSNLLISTPHIADWQVLDQIIAKHAKTLGHEAVFLAELSENLKRQKASTPLSAEAATSRNAFEKLIWDKQNTAQPSLIFWNPWWGYRDENLARFLKFVAPYVATPEFQPIREFCANHCPQTEELCNARAAYSLPTPLFFASPTEALLSTSVYWQSARFKRHFPSRAYVYLGPGKTTGGYIDVCFPTAVGKTVLQP